MLKITFGFFRISGKIVAKIQVKLVQTCPNIVWLVPVAIFISWIVSTQYFRCFPYTIDVMNMTFATIVHFLATLATPHWNSTNGCCKMMVWFIQWYMKKIMCDEKTSWYFSADKIWSPNSFWAPRTSIMKFGTILIAFGQQFFRKFEKTQMWFWAWRFLKSIFLVETFFKQKLWIYIYQEKITRTP